MKKISLMLGSLCALLALSSCEDEKKPVYRSADGDRFEVYAQPLENQYYELTDNGTFEILCKSAPSWGAPMGPTKYGAVISLDKNFADTKEIVAENGASSVILRDNDLAVAICQLLGLTKEDAGYVFENTLPVYIKITSWIEAIPDSKVTTKNYCVLNRVMPYFAIPTPGFIYLVGAPEGWAGPTASNAGHYEDWKLYERDEEIGSKVYYGTFEVPQGSAMFRFYTSLTNWDTDSYGSQVDDNPIDCTLNDKFGYMGDMVKGKGAFNFPTWPGGQMGIRVDLSGKPTLEIWKMAE